MNNHRIENEIDLLQFLELINGIRAENIRITQHTFFHLLEKQRKIFKGKIIIDLLLGKTPIFVGIQKNNLYAVFYKYGKHILKIIIDIQANELRIITFHLTGKIPRLK